MQISPQLLGAMCQFASVHAGHVDVSNQEFDVGISSDLLQGFKAGLGGNHTASEVFEHGRERFAHGRIIINAEHCAGHVRYTLSACPHLNAAIFRAVPRGECRPLGVSNITAAVERQLVQELA
jgi:hypothetical protein